MRAVVGFVCVLGVIVASGACGPDNPAPSLTISPGGAVTVTQPTTFSAELFNVAGEVAWTLEGAGTLSGTTGLHVSYAPPVGAAAGAATLTAKVGGLTASVAITTGPSVFTAKKITGLKGAVTVLYDAQDIPHIKCSDIADCLAVQGYVHAHDRFFPMDFLRHVARGRLSELIGLDGLSQDVQLRTLFITRAGHPLADDLVAALDPSTKALLDAYVAGVNAYIAELRAGTARLPGEYAQLPFRINPADTADLPAWTAADTLAMARLQQFQLSSSLTEETANGQFFAVYGPGGVSPDLGKVNAWIRAAAPPSERAHTLSPGPVVAAMTPPAPRAAPSARVRAAAPVPAGLAPWRQLLAQATTSARGLDAALRPLGSDVGSNNWVVSGAKSATGKAMVANDPHLTLQYPPLFHLAVMTSTKAADGLDLAGGAFPGIPGALVGRGAHVGWGVTVVGYDVTDLYLEQFLPQANCPGADAGPPCVLWKGVPTSTLPVPQVFKVRTATGAAGLVDARTLGLASPPPSAVLVIPHHGPIIQAPDAAGKAVSARWTGQEGNTNDVKAILGLNTAANVDAAIAALKGFSTGAQNFVLADDQGHIAYDPHALVPVRKFTEGAQPKPPWFPLPGDGTAEWGDGVHDCAAATATPVDAACWISDETLPQGKDPAKGYFVTANADPTFPSVSDGNNPLDPARLPYLSHSWSDPSGFRATQIEARIEAALAGGRKMTLADMESIQADHVSRPGKLFTPIIAALPTAGAPPELAFAQVVLNQWATNGWDCPSGLTGTDPKNSAADATPKVVQDSAGCFLFHVFLRQLMTNVFADDLKFAKQGVNGLAAVKAMLYMLDPATPEADRNFCDDVSATGAVTAAHTCTEQVATAVVGAYRSLVTLVGRQPTSWTWGRAHTMRPTSLLALVTTDYSPGPYARPGGLFTVDVGNPSLASAGLDFGYVSSANVRHISVMDAAQPKVRMQLPGPERDGPTVLPGPDLLGQWASNTYFDFAFGNQIDGVAVATQSFSAP